MKPRFVDRVMPLLHWVWCIELTLTALWSSAIVRFRPDWIGATIAALAWLAAGWNWWGWLGVWMRLKNSRRTAVWAVRMGIATALSPVVVAGVVAIQEQVDDGSPLATVIGMAISGAFLGVLVVIPGLIGHAWLTSWRAFLRDYEP